MMWVSGSGAVSGSVSVSGLGSESVPESVSVSGSGSGSASGSGSGSVSASGRRGSRRWELQIAVLLVIATAVPSATAEPAQSPAPVIEDREGAGVIDWTRGLVIARGAAAADLRARSPDVARVGAERRARQRARKGLRSLAGEVSFASGDEVAALVDGAPEAAARLSSAVETPIDVEIDYGTDGSVVARLGLPLEAIRAAIEGPRPPPKGGEITGLVVRAEKVLKRPSLGFELVAGGESYAGPVVFLRRGSGAPDTDPRLGENTLEARASAVDGGAITVDMEPGALARARASGALVMVVLGPAP